MAQFYLEAGCMWSDLVDLGSAGRYIMSIMRIELALKAPARLPELIPESGSISISRPP